MNLELILHRKQGILFLFSHRHCEGLPNFVLVIGGEANPITYVIINAQKKKCKINNLMSLPLNAFLEESFISLDVLTDDYVNTLEGTWKGFD